MEGDKQGQDIDLDIEDNSDKEQQEAPIDAEELKEVEQVRVEDLPLDKRIQLAKSIGNPFGQIKPGLWVDAIDSINTWCMSQITDIEDNLLRIHFDGWPNKWDEWMKVTSYKVAPFRKHSEGYTGQTKVAIRKVDMTEDDYLKMIEKMDICIKNNLKGLGALETTQFYRGEVFMILDHLMGKSYEGYAADQFDLTVSFIKKVLELIATYIKLVPKMLGKLEEYKIEPDLYLVDENIAIACCSTEFSEMLKTIFCLNPRCIRFYLRNTKAPENLVTNICKEYAEPDHEMLKLKYDDLDFDDLKDLISKKVDLEFGLFYEFLDHFHLHGGFDGVRSALKCITSEDHQHVLPLNFIPDLTSPFKNCGVIMNPEYAKEMTEEIQGLILNRLENMTDNETKDLDKSTVTDLLNEIREFLVIALDEASVDEKLESAKLLLALRFLKSSNMKQRLNGINDIKHIIDMTSETRRVWHESDSPRRSRWLKPEYLCQWMHDNKLTDLLFGESSHIEVVKRSAVVLKFLSHQRQLTKEHLDLLWKCQEGKHEATVLGVFETINEIALDLSIESLDYIFTKIRSIPLKKYNEQVLNFVKSFTVNALQVVKSSKTTEILEINSDDEEEEKHQDFYLENARDIFDGTVTPPNDFGSQYGLPIIWELMHQNTELGALALKALISLLKLKCSDYFRIEYILKCIKNLQNHTASYQSLTCMISILSKAFSTKKRVGEKSRMMFALGILQREFDLISLTIDDIEHYNSVVQKTMVDSINKGIVPENIPKTCFEGGYQHSEQLEKRLEFIEVVIYQMSGEISFGNATLEKLWNIFVKQAAFEFDTNLFFKWVNKEKYQKSQIQTKEHRKIFTREEREYLFLSILCSPDRVDSKEISYSCFKCFEKFFGYHNRENKNMIYVRGVYRVLSFENISGLDTLWDIAIKSEDPKVKEDSSHLLSVLHLNLDEENYDNDSKVQIWKVFIERCQEYLSPSNEKHHINSAIALLLKFLDIYDGRDLNPNEASQSTCFSVTVYCTDDNNKKVLSVPYSQDLSYLRKMIAEAFDISVNEFTLHVNQKQVTAEDDDTAIRDIGFAALYVISKLQNVAADQHPKNLLVGSQDFFERMFDFLSDEESYDVENIWKLLMKLPQDEVPTAKKIQKLEVEDEAGWDELIDGSSLHKLLYSLQIVSKLLQTEPDWQNKFLVMGGVNHLFKTFLKLDPVKIHSTLAFKSVDTLCKIIVEAMEKNQELMAHFKEKSSYVVDKIIRIIHQIGKMTIQDLKKRGESYDEIYHKNRIAEQKNFRMFNYYSEKNKNDNEEEEQNQYTRIITALAAKFDSIGKFVQLSFRLLYHFDAYSNEACAKKFNEYEHLEEMLKEILLDTDNFYYRDQFIDGLGEIMCHPQHILPDFIAFKKRVLTILVYDISKYLEVNPVRAYKYYDLLYKLLSSTHVDILKEMDINFEEVLAMKADIIINKESTEKTSEDLDTILCGSMRVARAILQQFPELRLSYGKKLLIFLLKDCLFEVPESNCGRTKVRPPKCKRNSSRGEAFKLINVLARDCLENLNIVLDFIKSLQLNAAWRTRKQADWNISPHSEEKSVTGYVGIKNLGCICYMIALLQQLYMIPSFRESILAIDDPKKNELALDDNLLYQLQRIFAFLHISEQQYYDPIGFTKAFKDWDGNETNVLIQMDVDEFFNMFMDKLETAIKGTQQEKMIQQHFGGTYANELICKGCPHYSERSEPYLAVNLQVKNKKSIKDSLDALIEGEMLDGDNSYYCEKCDKKVPTLKRTCIKKLPKHLILVLKRFEFDYDVMQKMKVNDYCEFPEELNMEPYTQEGLKRREKKQEADEKNEELDEDELKPKYPLELYNYKLSGVLVHSGFAEGGHYYSFIKDREESRQDKWYEFNDEYVKEFDKSELEGECFGGEEKWGDMMGPSIYLKSSEKHRNAYVLFYERIAHEDIPYSDDEDDTKDNKHAHNEDDAMKDDNDEEADIKMGSEKESSLVGTDAKMSPIKTIIKIPDEIGQIIKEENRKYWQYKFMFSKEYSEFMIELCSLWNTKHIVLLNYDTRNRDYHLHGIDEKAYKEELKKNDKYYGGNYCSFKNIKFYPEKHLLPTESVDIYPVYGGEKVDAFEFEIFKLTATFYLTVIQRASLKESVPELLDLIKAHLNKSLKACRWLICQFTNNDIILEMLLQCPYTEMRKLTVGLIYCAMINLYEEEKEDLDSYWQYKEGLKDSYSRTYIGNFINMLINYMKVTKRYTEYSCQFYSIISRFAFLGKEARLYLLKAKMIGRVIAYYQQDASPFVEFFNDYSDVIFEENTHVELGYPTKIEDLKLSLWEELSIKKRDNQIATAQQDYTSLFELLSLLIRSCVFKAVEAPTFVDDMRYDQLHDNEYLSLQFDDKDVGSLLDCCTTKLASKHLGSVFLHLSSNNQEFDHMMRSVLVNGIMDKQLDELKAYFPIFKRFLFIQDEHTEDRISESVRDYFNVLKNNQKYAQFMAKFTSYLVKLANINRGVAEVLASCPEEWDFIIDWMRKNPCPAKANPQYKNHAREFATTQYKIRRLEDIKSGNINTYENEYDSDDDLSDHKFAKSEKIDYRNAYDTWSTAEVAIVLDEMIHIQFYAFNHTKGSWFPVDNEQIAPHLAMQNRHDTKFIEEQRVEVENQLRKNMQQHQEESGSGHVMSESDRYSQEVVGGGNDSVSDD